MLMYVSTEDRCDTFQLNAETGCWEPAIPEPYSYGLFPWIWRRITGWRDAYGRKAQLFWE